MSLCHYAAKAFLLIQSEQVAEKLNASLLVGNFSDICEANNYE